MALQPTPMASPVRVGTSRRGFARLRFAGWLFISLASAVVAGSATLARASASRPAPAVVQDASSGGAIAVQTAPPKVRSLDILDSIREDVDPPPPPVAAPAPPPPAPAPVPAPEKSSPAPAPPPVAPPPPVLVRDMLISANGALHTGVGIYSDCTGRTALTHAEAAIDTCVHNLTYFVGHNPGVFTPLLHMGVGSVITWYDHNATAHRLVVVAARTWTWRNGVPPPVRSGEAAQFQTCLVPDGSSDLILDTVAA